MQYSKELQDLCENIFDKKYMISLAKSADRKSLILNATSWIDEFWEKIPLKIRCIAIQNSYDENTFPKCPNCELPVGYDKVYQSSLRKFCSDKCSKEFGRMNDVAKEKLNDFDWLYDARMNRKLSYKAIGDELGVSEGPIKPACKRLNVPMIRLNSSQPIVTEKLNNYDLLYDLHVVQRKRLVDIADIIGSSGPIVGVALQRLGIEANKPNSYPRNKKTVSAECEEVISYIKSISNTTIEIDNRSVLDGREIDILLPELNIGFEYNGLYSHYYRPDVASFSGRKDKSYHLNKKQFANKNGIDLIHIFSDDWKHRKYIVQSMISSKLHKNTKIFARKCNIVIPTNQEKLNFLAENHLQGKDKSSMYCALEYNNEIVAMMTFCKSRYNKKYDWELSRFVAKKYTNVIGGFSKLLSYFKKNCSGSIISYADRNHSTGDVYKKNGFYLLKVNPPGYKYVNFAKHGEQRLHRSNFTKKKIAPNDPRPEHEVMYERGYMQIFDCGTLTFVIE